MSTPPQVHRESYHNVSEEITRKGRNLKSADGGGNCEGQICSRGTIDYIVRHPWSVGDNETSLTVS